MMGDLFSTGLLFEYGPLWRANRKAFDMLSTPRMLHHIADVIFPRNAHVLVDALYRSADDRKIVDLQVILQDWLTAVFGDLAFDVCHTDSLWLLVPRELTARRRLTRRCAPSLPQPIIVPRMESCAV